MRLLHTKDLTFKEFLEGRIPLYAILSHRWGEEEASYHDFLNNCREGTGWIKIQKACEIAQTHGLHWVWIDTCCIDKSSSAELSEAINSMYEWYKRSTECYAFLPDVNDIDTARMAEVPPGTIQQIEHHAPFSVSEFHASVWHTRGWCLQELLAPRNLLFFNSSFSSIGDKISLVAHIEQITQIAKVFLLSPQSIHRASVAERMIWASRRQTTRPEDKSYCLLGIFDVNLPLLYGERDKAFLRLQEAIIAQSDDETVFAWQGEMMYGLLARDPADFRQSPRGLSRQDSVAERHYELTNKGVRFTLNLTTSTSKKIRIGEMQRAVFPLNCHIDEENEGVTIGLEVKVRRDANTRIMWAWPAVRRTRLKLKSDRHKWPKDCGLILEDAFESAQDWTIYFHKDSSMR